MKRNLYSTQGCLLLTAVGLSLAFGVSARAQAPTPPEVEYNKQYRSYHDVPLGENYTGRSPYLRPKGEPEQPAPAPRHIEIVKPVERPTTCSEMTTGLIRMSKRMPAEVSLGQEFMYELNPTATA